MIGDEVFHYKIMFGLLRNTIELAVCMKRRRASNSINFVLFVTRSEVESVLVSWFTFCQTFTEI